MTDQRKTIRIIEKIIKDDPMIMDRIKPCEDPLDQRETVKLIGKMLRDKYEDKHKD